MCIQCVQVAVQFQSHRLLKVRPVEVSQHVEQVPADLLYQGLKRVGELLAWREKTEADKRDWFMNKHHEGGKKKG